VRIALGAAPTDLLGIVFKQGMLQIFVGLAVGLLGAFADTRVLGAMLVGIGAADPLTFASVGLILWCAGALGCAIPARRATHVDPVLALRTE
jgi:putative ABC transport system permease protein